MSEPEVHFIVATFGISPTPHPQCCLDEGLGGGCFGVLHYCPFCPSCNIFLHLFPVLVIIRIINWTVLVAFWWRLPMSVSIVVLLQNKIDTEKKWWSGPKCHTIMANEFGFGRWRWRQHLMSIRVFLLKKDSNRRKNPYKVTKSMFMWTTLVYEWHI